MYGAFTGAELREIVTTVTAVLIFWTAVYWVWRGVSDLLLQVVSWALWRFAGRDRRCPERRRVSA